MITTRAKGVFVWYELATSDSKAAQKFYSHVLGWKAREMGGPEGSYTIVTAGPADVGGISTIPPNACGAHAKPAWMSYIGVDDVDAATRQVEAAGGVIHREPSDIPGIGRFSVVADPQGAVFALITPLSREPLPPIPQGTPGHVGWRELHAGDGKSAYAFYENQFGWTRAEAMDMGAMGVYQIFSTGDATVGAVMTKMPVTPAPFWMFYFNVPALDAASARVKEAGGKLLIEPMPVPGALWIMHCSDPQGARFALVAPQR